MKKYAGLLERPGAASFFLTASLGRVGIAMTPLGLVWLIGSARGSYGAAGIAVGAFAVAEAVLGPHVARLFDRYGQTAVLPVLAALQFGMACSVVSIVHTTAPLWLLCANAAAMGTTIPPLGAVSAARWVSLLEHENRGRMRTAFSLEAVANSVVFLVGPVVVSALGAYDNASIGILAAAGLISLSSVSLALQRRTAPSYHRGSAAGSESTGSRRLFSSTFMVLLVLNVCIGLYFGSMQVGVASFTTGLGVPHAAPVILAVAGGAGVLGGTVFGALSIKGSPQLHLLITSGALGFFGIFVVLASTVTQLGLAVVLTEVLIPPTLALFNVLLERTVPRRVITQAFSWMGAGSAAGSAFAAAVAGNLADAYGGGTTFLPILAAAATMVLLTAMLLRQAGTTMVSAPAGKENPDDR